MTSRAKPARSCQFPERRIAFELKGEYDLVTEADRACEALIVERLQIHFPSHSHRRARRAAQRDTPGASTAGTSIRWTAPPTSPTAFPPIT